MELVHALMPRRDPDAELDEGIYRWKLRICLDRYGNWAVLQWSVNGLVHLRLCVLHDGDAINMFRNGLL